MYCILRLTFFSKTSKIRIYLLKFFKLWRFQYFAMILINLINDAAFVSAATADAYFIIHLVCLFMKTHLLALLQDNYLDLFVVLS